MVCLGNICRSPLAEGILQHKANQAGLNWVVDSAGTGGYHTGEPPHKLSQKVAKMNGIDICNQQARTFRASDFDDFDFIYAMDSDNYENIKRMAGKKFDASKADLLLNSIYPGQNRSVPDPWYGTEPGYHDVFGLISRACDAILEKHLQESRQHETA